VKGKQSYHFFMSHLRISVENVIEDERSYQDEKNAAIRRDEDTDSIRPQ